MSDQATMQSPSVEDRALNALFGEPSAPQKKQPVQQEMQQPDPEQGQSPEVDAQAEGQPQEPDFEEIEYEGERFQVPKKLSKAIMQERDYTQKTQSLAETRKAVELTQQQFKLAQEQQQFLDSVQSDVDTIRNIDAYLKQPIDWQSMPVEELIRKRAEIDTLQQKRNELHSELSRKEQDFRGSLQKKNEELQKTAREVLARKIPGWNAEMEKSVKDWAISQGFTSEEVGAILNPVHAETLYKAHQYDKLVANKSLAAQQAKSAAPIGKPNSANPMPQDVKDKLSFNKQLKQTAHGSFEQKQLVERRLGSMFAKR